MTWKPSHGLWSTENFDSVDGFTGTNLSIQTVTGGYAALIPQIHRSISYLHSWAPISGWQVNNSLNTRTLIEADFMVTGGRVNPSDTATGYQKSAGAGGMWEIFTPPLLGPVPTLSGQTFEYCSLETASPHSGYYYRMKNSSDSLVVEFDVASHIALDNTKLIGITGGHLTGLPALTGRVNHGLYISNGPNWDFLECRPDGIRSFNHPEIAFPVSLSQPSRFRVGVRNNDLFVLHEGGQGIAALGQFDTATTSHPLDPILAFGAPYTGHHFSFPSGESEVQGFEGKSYWDNFKVITDADFQLDTPDKFENVYTTASHSLYTPPFEAGVSLRRWDSAVITYVPKHGGITEVTPQYLTSLPGTDTTGWVGISTLATTLVEGAHTARIPLGGVPASVPSSLSLDNKDHSIRSTQSTIRFLIVQYSLDGSGPAPLVDSIQVQGFKDLPYLETVPDWKPVSRPADIGLYIRSEKYLRNRMEPKASSVFFFRSPRVTGAFSGTFASLGDVTYTGDIVGTGEVVAGPYDTAFQNYRLTTGIAETGSPAGRIFGTTAVSNFVPDPLFSLPFRDVSAMENHVTGYQKGEVGTYVEMPRDWTGQVPMEFIQHPVHRLGSSTNTVDYAQKVNVLGTPYDNACGIEVLIPGGLVEVGKKGIFKFSLLVEAVDDVDPPNIVAYASGHTLATGHFTGTQFTGAYRTVSIPVDFVGTGNSRLGIVATGNRGNFIVDNLELAPITTAHISCTGVISVTKPFGVIGSDYSFYTNDPPANPQRAATVASLDLFLDLYPTGTNVLLANKRRTDNLGFSMSINAEGFLVCDYDVFYDAELSGGFTGTYETFTGTSFYNTSTGEVFYGSHSITGEMPTPLGRWSNIGFIHESHSYRRYGGRVASGQSGLGSIASCNRAFLTIDGLPVASQDTMTGWLTRIFSGYTGFGEDSDGIPQASPLPTYIATLTGDVVLASGLFCKVDNVNISRPPSADAESALYLDAARAGFPYFQPDVTLKPGGVNQDFTKNNAISNTTTGDDDSPGIYTHSVWNLDNPGPITNWDHGANRNHLLFYGAAGKDTGSPYGEDFGSTKFPVGAYAKAPFSSSLHRFIHSSGHWAGQSPAITPLWPSRSQLIVGGWVYARATGAFFEMSQDELNPTATSLALEIFSSTGVRLRKRSGAEQWSFTGYLTGEGNFLGDAGATTGEWHHIGFELSWSGQDSRSQYVSGLLSIDGATTGLGHTGMLTGFWGTDFGPEYEGSVDGGAGRMTSAMFLGRGMDCNLADFFVATDPKAQIETTSSPILWDVVSSKTGDKGGIYNQVYYDGQQFTGAVVYNSYIKATVTLPASSTPKETTLWAGANEYANDEAENLEHGIALLPSTSFTEAESYYFRYDDLAVNKVFGGTDSPIRIGFALPDHAIGLARIDSPSYTVPGSITTIDLSDSNPSNLSTFRGGEFSLSRSNTEHFGRLIRRDTNGSFEQPNLANSTTVFYNLGEQNLVERRFQFLTLLPFDGWTIQGAKTAVLGPDSAYDVVPGCYAGTGAAGLRLDDKTAVTGAFYVSPLQGLHSLGMHMASGDNSEGVAAIHTNLDLREGKEHLFTMSCRQPYYPGNTDSNITATIVAVSGGLSIPLGEGVIAWWNPTSGEWAPGGPNGYDSTLLPVSGQSAMTPNAAPNDTSTTKVSFKFITDAYPFEGPETHAIWISHTGYSSVRDEATGQVTDSHIDFVVIDEAHVYEIATSQASGTFRGINSGDYTGQFDMTFHGQVDTDDLRITSLAVSDPELDAPAEAYYAYLIGRGDYAVSIPDSFPHAISGDLTPDTRSGLADNYMSNLESIKKRIEVRGSDGKPVPEFQWDIFSSPYTYRDLNLAVEDNKSIAVDGVGSGSYTGFLPNGLFSVVMISPQLPDNGKSIFLHYPAHNIDKGTLDNVHREIYNPIPVMRETLEFEVPLAGQFSTRLDDKNQKFFDVTVYGLNSGFSGDFF